MPMNDVLHALEEVLDGAAGEVMLDFSPLGRIDPSDLRALEELAATATGKSLRITLRNVNPDVYRVLKLVNLDRRFSFAN